MRADQFDRSIVPGPVPIAVIQSNGRWSLGDMVVGFKAADASATWPTANLAVFVPFYARVGITPQSAYWMNGSAVSGNVDCGIYDLAGNRLASTGSTAQSGTSTPQSAALTSFPYLAPGQYFMALALDNTTGTIDRYSLAAFPTQQMFGMQQATSAFALPSTVTLGNPANAYIPVFGIGMGSAI